MNFLRSRTEPGMKRDSLCIGQSRKRSEALPPVLKKSCGLLGVARQGVVRIRCFEILKKWSEVKRALKTFTIKEKKGRKEREERRRKREEGKKEERNERRRKTEKKEKKEEEGKRRKRRKERGKQREESN